MAKCPLVPDQRGYRVRPGSSSVAVQLEGGAPWERETVVGAWSQLSLRFTCEGDAEYDALLAWRDGGRPWTMDLKLSSQLREHTVVLVPGSFETVDVEDGIYLVAVDVWADPEPIA